MKTLLVGCCLLLTACASNVYNSMLARGYPEPYARGFSDEHQSGMRAGGDFTSKFVKDVDGGTKYAEGWSDGYNLGESSFSNIMQNMN